MGFLSRKNKFASAPVADEPHPIVEELEAMEEAVPEAGSSRPEPRVLPRSEGTTIALRLRESVLEGGPSDSATPRMRPVEADGARAVDAAGLAGAIQA